MLFSNPRKISDNFKIYEGRIAALCPTGKNSRYISELCGRFGIACGENGAEINGVFDKSRDMTYVEESRRLTDEKYVIDGEVVDGCLKLTVTYSSERSFFYALSDIERRMRLGGLFTGRITEYPLFSRRGFIEGFYGTPWTQEARLDMLRLMARHRMNTYFYAPKDDEYHREKWDELYPENELLKLRKVVETAKNNYIDIWFCIAPGLSMRYSDSGQYEKLTSKLTQLYDIGIRRFGLLLDDIPEKLIFEEDTERFGGETVNAHIYLVNSVYDFLKSLDRSAELTVCPLQYHGRGDEYFISKLGTGIEPDINIFWTGRNICSQELCVSDAARFIESTRHKPLYWDNFPVNDAEMYNEMHIGYISGRDPELYRYSSGLISNCMEFSECSKIPLLTAADFLWNPIDYDAEKSWRYALRAVLGDGAERFSYFADNLLTSCLKTDNSVMLCEALSSVQTSLRLGLIEKAYDTLIDYSQKVCGCVDLITARSGEKLFNEIKRWSDKFILFGKIIGLCAEYIKNPLPDIRIEIIGNAEKYFRLPEILTDFCFREFIEYMVKEKIVL